MLRNSFRSMTIFAVVFISAGLVILVGNSASNGGGSSENSQDELGAINVGQSASKVSSADGLISTANGRSEKINVAPANRPLSQSFAERFPSGFMAAADQAVMKGDGKTAYELVGLLRDCETMPAEMERHRESLADLQTQGVLKPGDRNLVDAILATLQRNNAFCQALSGDLKARRLQLLEVAVRAGIDGSGMDLLLAGNSEPWVTAQVRREAESGDILALRQLATVQIPPATRLQLDAARDAIVRAARDAELQGDPRNKMDDYLASVERQVALEAWALDQNNPTKRAIAKAAYQGNGAPKVEPSTDPQVTALSTRYLEALKKRRRAEAPQP